jgi:LysR family hydrogen peroxide-inducible transcriptional activator
MNIRDLKYIVKLAETRNFAAAASLCNVSQPALSLQVQKLEDELGIKIFERERKKFLITNAGAALIKKAELILKTEAEMFELAKFYTDPFAGNLTIGAFPTLAPYYFPQILPRLNKQLPKLKFYLAEEKTGALIEKLQNGQLDAAFIAIPANAIGLEYIEIFTDEFMAAVPTTHPLAKNKSITRSQFAKEKLLLLEDGHCLKDQALEFCELLSNYILHDFRATSMETLLGMVTQNLGVTLVPKLAAQKRQGIIYLPFDKNPPLRKIGLYFRTSSPKRKVMEKLAQIIKN